MASTEAQKRATATYRLKNRERVAEQNRRYFKTWWGNNKELQRKRTRDNYHNNQRRLQENQEIDSETTKELTPI